MFDARKIATWVIAMAVVSLLYQLATDQTDVVATPVGLVVLAIALLFRNRIFNVVHAQVDVALDKSAKAVTGAIERPEAEAAFDPDAAFARYMEKRVVEDVAAADAGSIAPAFAPPRQPRGFGRKGV